MAYQAPITIKKALERIHTREYVLPAIQREFVWAPSQIAQLFDSLLRRYPIGAFLFWNVDAERSRDFVFYEFMESYHERTHFHCARLNLPDQRPVTAILDGQQRLTALNIGLNGSYAEKLPRKWASSPDAYPVKELYLDLCHAASDDEFGMHYRFDFLTPERARDENSSTRHWYRVRNVLDLEEGTMPLFDYIATTGVDEDLRRDALATLDRLRRAVHEEPVVSYHEEEDQDIDRVLNIFIRVNSAGTELSYSDLLLSIATAQWTERDAREEINDLVDSLNVNGQGFGFSKDLVLKAGLVMTDASDVRFKVANFNRANMATLQTEWERIDTALSIAARLLASFGFSDRTLTADTVLTPIADYLYQRGVDDTYLTRGEYADDRRRVREWVIRSLLKAGVWAGIDTLLVALRRVIRERKDDGFPLDAMLSAMALRFDREEIEDLVETQYSGRSRAFALLALLYPGIDVRNEFHVDHIFPRSRFTAKRLQDAGVPPEQVPDYLDRVNRLPNLQLLEGPINVAKLSTLPLAWTVSQYPDADQRGLYVAGHDLDGLPEDVTHFLEFFDRRRQRMIHKLRLLLAVERDAEVASAEEVIRS